MICSGLLKLVISQGGKVTARTTTRTCHRSRACDLYPQWETPSEDPCFSLFLLSFSLSRNTQVSTCTPHLNFNGCLKPCSDTHTHAHTHTLTHSHIQTQTVGFQQSCPRKSAFIERSDSWIVNVCVGGVSCYTPWPFQGEKEVNPFLLALFVWSARQQLLKSNE